MDGPDSMLLHSAAASNDLEAGELLLKEKGVDVYLKDDKGLTLWHILIQMRMENFKSVHSSWREKYSARDLKISEQFIDMLLKYTSAEPKCTLLDFCAACTLEDCATAESLLKKIADINQSIGKNDSLWPGYTALHFAAHCNVEMVKMLIGKGGNLLKSDAQGLTPLDVCIKSFSTEEVISILTTVTTWKEILFSDGKTKLMDYLSSSRDSDSHRKFLPSMKKHATLSLPENSPLWPGWTILHVAVTLLKECQHKMLKDILVRKTDVTIQDSRGSTPIHLAFCQDKMEFLGILFQHHKKVLNPLNKDNLSHLHIACAENDTSIVKKLLSIEANINIAYKGKRLSMIKPGWTPLHVACFNEHDIVVEMLLKAGANLLQTDDEGFTAVHRLFGTHGKKSSILDLLTDSKQFKNSKVEGIGLTHLHVMAYWNKADAVERVLNSGSDIEATIGDIADENLKQYSGCTPLHLAAMYHYTESVKVLLERGAGIFAKDSVGRSPVSIVLAGKGKEMVLKLFVSRLLGNEELQKRMEEETGLTMLHVVCRAVDVEKMKILLDKEVDIDARLPDDSWICPGFTPLHTLIYYGYGPVRRGDTHKEAGESLKLLLDKKADVTLTDVDGDSPVHLIFKYLYCRDKKQGRIQASLLMKGHRDFSINPTNKEGLSHFHIACLVCNPTVVAGLLRSGADANQPVGESGGEFVGKSPLHLALNASAKRISGAEMQLQTVDILLEYGANVDAVDPRGWTPLHNAAKCGPNRQELLDKIVRVDTDMNKETFNGETPFEILIESDASIKEIKYFADHGSRVNGYNRINNKGYMALILTNKQYFVKELWDSILNLMMSLPDIAEVDGRGRNAIYNTYTALPTYLRGSGSRLQNLT